MTNEKRIQDGIHQEQRLIEWMRRDLKAGFSKVVIVYRPHLLRVADGVLGDTPRLAHLAEDVVQDGLLNAFMHLARHPRTLKHQEDGKPFQLRAWLTRIIHNQALLCLREGEEHFTINAGLLGEEVEWATEEGYLTHYHDPIIEFERLERIHAAKETTRQLLASLTPDQRTAVEYLYLAEPKPGENKITYEQAAKALGKPVGTIKSHVSRAKKQMREQLTRHPEEESSQNRKLG